MKERNIGAYEVILKLAKRAKGVGQEDEGVTKGNIYRLQNNGKLFTIKTGIGTEKKRYFDTQERADAFYKDRKPSKNTHPKSAKTKQDQGEAPVVHIAKAVPGGPARLPGDAHYPTNPDGSPAYKITIAPPPPAVLYRTGTHNYH